MDDFFENFSKAISLSAEYRKLPRRMKVSLSDCLDNYKHTTFKITCVADYIKIVTMLQKLACSELTEAQMAYRGQENYTWNLCPSLWRLQSSDENTEHNMISEFVCQSPNDFKDINNNFDLLAKMQHYGLPTRLLDFTTNPLVALYFACENESSSTARILAHCYVDNNNGEVIDTVCSSWKYDCVDNVKVDDLLKEHNLSLLYFFFYLFGYKGATLFKRPKYWNQRLKNQSALFMVFPDSIHDLISRDIRDSGDECSDSENDNTVGLFKSIMQKENYKNIYPQIKYQFRNEEHIGWDFSVSEKTWFKLKNSYIIGDVNLLEDNTSRDIKYGLDSGLSELGKKVLLNRFALWYDEEPLSEDVINYKFCSILIPKNCKKRIISELAMLGIDVGFIYPELEYTAQKIKAKYI